MWSALMYYGFQFVLYVSSVLLINRASSKYAKEVLCQSVHGVSSLPALRERKAFQTMKFTTKSTGGCTYLSVCIVLSTGAFLTSLHVEQSVL